MSISITKYTNPYISHTNVIEMGKEYLGEFEELVLTMVGIIREEAYGNTIVNEIKNRVDRTVNLSAVHVTLYRLEDKGLVKSAMGGAPMREGEDESESSLLPMQAWPCFVQ